MVKELCGKNSNYLYSADLIPLNFRNSLFLTNGLPYFT